MCEVQKQLYVSDFFKYILRKFLRLAPVYWFIFFVSWVVFPNMGAGPIWFGSRGMFLDCSKYWWTQLLFVSNIFPYFNAPNEGCFFWGYYIECDF